MMHAMNGLTVYALASELDAALRGASIEEVRRYAAGLTIALAEAPARYVHILQHRRDPELFCADAPVAPPGFGRREMEPLERRGIRGVRPLGLERVLLVDLEEGGGWGERGEARLRIDLTPAARPLSLYEGSEGRLASSTGPRRSRATATSEESLPAKELSLLALPPRPPADLLAAEEDRDEHDARLPRLREMRELAAALSSRVGGIDPVLAGALARAARSDPDRAWEMAAAIARRVAARDWSWRIYRLPEEGAAGACVLYPVELPFEAPNDAAESWAAALARRARECVVPAYAEHLRGLAARRAQRELRRLARLREHLAADIADAERAEEHRHFGELLVTYRHQLKAGMSEIVVKDFSGDREVAIPLDPARSPERNIRRYFTKAKKGEKGALIIRERARAVEREAGALRAEIGRIAALEDTADLVPLVPVVEDAGAARAAAEPKRFRRYAIDERHFVLVGRSDAENDELTHKSAAPSDLWFHAQDVPGSHVVLKGAHRSTSRAVIEKAAAIAAWFSKARSSRTVPVIYAEKRHVRKPRKAKPGTAVCTRGKTIFVKPLKPADGGE